LKTQTGNDSAFGNENWEFDDDGLMRLSLANINDLPITESERKYHWPLGRRPDNHPGLSDYGLTLPELRILLNGFDYMSRGPRQNFRKFKRLCEERFGVEALKLPDHRSREFRNTH